jgi:hypothetical protein
MSLYHACIFICGDFALIAGNRCLRVLATLSLTYDLVPDEQVLNSDNIRALTHLLVRRRYTYLLQASANPIAWTVLLAASYATRSATQELPVASKTI